MTNIPPYAWAAAGIATVGLGAYFTVRVLPRLPAHLAAHDKLITVVPENHWAPVERGGKYIRGLLVKKGFHLNSEGHIVRGLDPDPRGKLVEWLGYKWLGWTAPRLTKRPTLEISATRLIDPADRGGKKVAEWVTQQPKPIRELKVTFPMYVLVQDIETTDGSKVTVLVRADIKIRTPYKTWYNFGGHALETLNTEIQKIVRVAFERHGIVALMQGKGEDKAEEEIAGDSKIRSGTQKGRLVKEVRNERLIEDTGAEVLHISIEDWDAVISNQIKEMLQREQTEIARRKAELARLITERETALLEQQVWDARTLSARKRKDTNDAIAAAFKILGVDKDTYNLLMINEMLEPGDSATTLTTRAITKTKLQWLGMGDLPFMAGLVQRGMTSPPSSPQRQTPPTQPTSPTT